MFLVAIAALGDHATNIAPIRLRHILAQGIATRDKPALAQTFSPPETERVLSWRGEDDVVIGGFDLLASEFRILTRHSSPQLATLVASANAITILRTWARLMRSKVRGRLQTCELLVKLAGKLGR